MQEKHGMGITGETVHLSVLCLVYILLFSESIVLGEMFPESGALLSGRKLTCDEY